MELHIKQYLNKVNRRRYYNNAITTEIMQTWENYGKFYYQNHKDAFREYRRRYFEKIKTAIVYKVKDQDGEIIYCGSTDSIYRLHWHSTCQSSKLNLKENKDWLLMYAEIDNVTRDELYYIEYMLIAKHNPILNVVKPSLELDKFDFMTNERKEELIQIAENLQFKIFTLN